MTKEGTRMKPALLSSLKTYNAKQFGNDLVAGLIVAIIALPLSIALAIASGVSPEQGIYTAVIAGFVIALLGGSRVQISGPTAAFATIVAGIVARNGMNGLIIATIIAGVILIIMGLCKLGNLIRFIPFTITTGFTAGIAVTIVLGQLKDFFGVTYPAGMETIETTQKVEAFFAGFGSFQWQALVVGIVCLAVLFVMPRIFPRLPGSLVAVVVGVLMVQFLPGFEGVPTIGNQYPDLKAGAPTLTMPEFSFEAIQNGLSDGFTIAVLAAIESLLSCVVADSMIHSKHDSNMELVAQGAGNIASVLFGGIPATGAIARTAANVKNGGRTPISGIVHAIVLFLILIVLMPYAKWIPMPCIAAILIMVAYNMCQWRTFVHMVKTAPKSDITVLVVTFLLTIIFDLVIAIEIGMLMACVFFMKRMSDETGVKSWKYVPNDVNTPHDENEHLMKLPESVRVYEITGPLFFGAASQLDHIIVKDMTKFLILRMRAVPSLDSTAMNALIDLYNRCQLRGVKMVLSHVNEQPYHAMKKAGFIDLVGEENIKPHIIAAIEHVTALADIHS